MSSKGAELLFKSEPLNPILRPHISKGALGPMLHHELVIEPLYRPELNAVINWRFASKLKAVHEAEQEKNFERILWLTERPYRLLALQRYSKEMSDDMYWESVGHIWCDSENIWQNHDEWRAIWECTRPKKEFAMDEDERYTLSTLPEKFTVYRGIHGRGATKTGRKRRLSWSLDRAKAEWFANRFPNDEPQIILEGTVARHHVHAYFNCRGEQEIVATLVY